MGRTATSYNRKAPQAKPQPAVLVICEDSKSSKHYLTGATYYYRVNVKVEVVHTGNTDPLGIINYAIAKFAKYDRIFCVIDRDAHPSFDKARRVAEPYQNIKVIASFPCFEYWYLLHFKHSTKPYNSIGKKSSGDHLNEDLRQFDGMHLYTKGNCENLFVHLLSKLQPARDRSLQIMSEAEEIGNFNPSTEAHLLIDFFEALGNLDIK